VTTSPPSIRAISSERSGGESDSIAGLPALSLGQLFEPAREVDHRLGRLQSSQPDIPGDWS